MAGKHEIMKILTLINLSNCWMDNTAGHLAGLFVTLTVFMRMCIYIMAR